MPQATTPPTPDIDAVLEAAQDENARIPEATLAQVVHTARQRGQDHSLEIDRRLIARLRHTSRHMRTLKQVHAQLEQQIQALTEGPLRSAVAVSVLSSSDNSPIGTRLVVRQGNQELLVPIRDGMDVSAIQPGDRVFLGGNGRLAVDYAPGTTSGCGQTAVFLRYHNGHQAVLDWRSETRLAFLSGRLAQRLNPGDTVRWDPEAEMVFEAVEQGSGSEVVAAEAPRETFDDIGGLDEQIGRIRDAILLRVRYPERAARLKLTGRGRSMLLTGRPGNGKTMIGRATANFIRQVTGAQRALFVNYRPGELLSMWFGESEARIRRAFKAIRRLASQNPGQPIVVFFDELDSIGTMRGAGSTTVTNDRVLPALLAEVDGLTDANIWLIAASNRPDVLDPALVRPGRFGDLQIQIPRPSQAAAAQILGKHLSPDMGYEADGYQGDQVLARQAIVDQALAYIYENATESRYATLHLRDGRQQPVTAADLVSGAMLAAAVLGAADRVGRRLLEADGSPETGLAAQDVLASLSEQFDAAARVLTPANCHHHLDLSEAAAVARVELPRRRPVMNCQFIDIT